MNKKTLKEELIDIQYTQYGTYNRLTKQDRNFNLITLLHNISSYLHHDMRDYFREMRDTLFRVAHEDTTCLHEELEYKMIDDLYALVLRLTLLCDYGCEKPISLGNVLNELSLWYHIYNEYITTYSRDYVLQYYEGYEIEVNRFENYVRVWLRLYNQYVSNDYHIEGIRFCRY